MSFKNCFFILAFLLITSRGNSQLVVWSEDFENGFPVNMTRINSDGLLYQGSNLYPNGWEVKSTWEPFIYFCASQVFGEAGMKVKRKQGDSIMASTSWYDPIGTASDWIITPQLTVPPNGYLCFQVLGMNDWSILNFSFDHYEVRVSNSGNSIGNFTTTLLDTYAPPEWRRFCVDLSAYAGQQVYLAFVNETYNNRYVFLDELELVQRFTHDASVKAVFDTTWSAVGRPTYPRGVIQNHGFQDITSLDLNYSVDNGPTVTQSISGISIGVQDTFPFVHSTPFTPTTAGFKEVEMWVSNINGSADQYTQNDIGTVQVNVYEAATERTSLLEIHSGDDCGPCANLNGVLAPIVDAWGANSSSGNIGQLEYQTYYTDPSDNADATARSNRYVVTGYPSENINGKDPDAISWYASDDQYHILTDYSQTWFSNQPAFIELDVALSIAGNTATVTVEVNPLVNFPSGNQKLYIAIAETEYTWTGGLTSQTDYHHVLRKMLPDAYGISLGPLTAGSPLTFTESYTFTIGNVTEGSFNLWNGMNNIEAVAFVQEDLTNVVHQTKARHATDPIAAVQTGEISSLQMEVYPNPSESFAWLGFELSQPGDFTVEILNLAGEVVMQLSAPGQVTGHNQVYLNTSSLSPGMYLVKISDRQRGVAGLQKLVKV